MYSAIASSASIASVGVVGAVIAASIDAMSDSRDAGVKLAPSRREAHGEKPARERRVHLFATGAHARSAGGGRFTAVRNEAPGGAQTENKVTNTGISEGPPTSRRQGLARTHTCSPLPHSAFPSG